ncbi:MAG: FAD-dependent oxidoreductase, partial [Proteobacteria bacterium]|nr:FAD-dependent oxidoreductase [Pseudomonadota bacterium]
MAEPWDVIIVGAGTAGMPAAIFAAHRGASVLVLEAAPEVGGTLHLSAGQMSAAGSRLQAEKGIEDTPDEH